MDVSQNTTSLICMHDTSKSAVFLISSLMQSLYSYSVLPFKGHGSQSQPHVFRNSSHFISRLLHAIPKQAPLRNFSPLKSSLTLLDASLCDGSKQIAMRVQEDWFVLLQSFEVQETPRQIRLRLDQSMTTDKNSKHYFMQKIQNPCNFLQNCTLFARSC